MQYGLKRESTEKINRGMQKVSDEIESLKQQIRDGNIDSSENYIETQLEVAEMSLTILSHTQESLMDFDFVILNKEEYDYVSRYLTE